jgi:probable rRNA maturation factor
MIHLQIKEIFKKEIKEESLHEAALAVYQHQEISLNKELSLVVDDDEVLHSLNLKHLGQDKATDVLSFPSGELDPDSGQTYLGDVIISYESALKQSKAAGHQVDDELQLLVVHGCLHLLGFDHAAAEEKEQMWSIQDEILNNLGVKITPND